MKCREKSSLSDNPSFSRKNIGERIRVVRGLLTYKKFAQSLNVSESYLSDIEKAKKKPNAEVLFGIATNYGYSINWVLTGVGPQDISSIIKQSQKKVDEIRENISNDDISMPSEELPDLRNVFNELKKAFKSGDP